MFLAKIAKISLIVVTFIVAYLPITINPNIFERIERGTVSYIATENAVSAIDY